MKSYWKVKTSCEKANSDLRALYGERRFFWKASEAEARCYELNEGVHGEDKALAGTFFFREAFVDSRGVFEDEDAAQELAKND